MPEITTNSYSIRSADGRLGYGSVTFTPNMPFEYDPGGGAVLVTTDPVQVAISNGVLGDTLDIAPNDGLSNTPVTYYIVQYDINGQQWTEYWQIDNDDGDPQEWNIPPRLPGPISSTTQILNSHLRDQNAHGNLVRYADGTVGVPAGNAADGNGAFVRINTGTNMIDSSIVNAEGANISIEDAGGHYTTDTVEDALQQVGSEIDSIESDVVDLQNNALRTDVAGAINTDYSNITLDGETVWHSGNDGAGSTLDAQYLQGYEPSPGAGGDTIAQRDASGRIEASDGVSGNDVINCSQHPLVWAGGGKIVGAGALEDADPAYTCGRTGNVNYNSSFPTSTNFAVEYGLGGGYFEIYFPTGTTYSDYVFTFSTQSGYVVNISSTGAPTTGVSQSDTSVTVQVWNTQTDTGEDAPWGFVAMRILD